MPNITRKDLSTLVAARLKEKDIRLTQQEISTVAEEWLDAIAENLENGSSVVMRRFGVFELRRLRAKIGRNPKAPDEVYPIPSRTVIRFRAGKDLAERIRRSHS